MPIATCPRCNRKISVNLEDLETEFECAKCGHVFAPLVIRRPAYQPERPTPPPSPEPAAYYDEELPQHSKTPLLLAVGSVACIALILGLMAFCLAKSDEPLRPTTLIRPEPLSSPPPVKPRQEPAKAVAVDDPVPRPPPESKPKEESWGLGFDGRWHKLKKAP